MLFIIAILIVILLIILGLRSLIFANWNTEITQTTDDDSGYVYKPVIYLYPTEDTNVFVKLKYKNNIVVSYPEYLEGWNVLAKTDEINKNMPIEINPNPDTIIRVLMTFKGLEEPMKVEEQKLITPNRNGFVAVEWGGTEIK